jgi:hypothetical protein
VTTTSPYASLVLYNSTTDASATFLDFRLVQSGPDPSSNMMKIDTALSGLNTRVLAVEAQKIPIAVNATYISPGYYEASGVSGITAYVTDMQIMLSLSATTSTSTTLNINSLGVKSLMKYNSTGTLVTVGQNSMVINRRYLFKYDGTQWVMIGNATPLDQISTDGSFTAGRFIAVSGNGLAPIAYDSSSFALAANGVTNGNSHDHNGGDGAAIVEAAITLADNTTNNVSITKHGFTPKAPNVATQFLDGTGSWDTVKDSDLATTDITTNDVSITKHGFAPKAPNVATQFLDGAGAWDTVKDSDLATTDITTNDTSTTKHGFVPKLTAPGSGLLNVMGIGNGETVLTSKALFDRVGWNSTGCSEARPCSSCKYNRMDCCRCDLDLCKCKFVYRIWRCHRNI